MQYERKDTTKINEQISLKEHKTLYEAVESFANDAKIDLANYSDTKASTLLRLRTNLTTFVAFKNYQRSADMIRALIDEKGNIRNYAAYEREVIRLGETYHKSWLKAEYNTVVASAQTAAQWNDFQDTKDIFPYLVYKTQDDNKVRMAHRSLHNVAKHIDDEFWDQYYPPNGWQCRCYVLQSRTDDGYTTDPTALPDDKSHPPAFRSNPGKTGKIWTDDHPYFDVTPKIKDKIISTRNDMIQDKSFYDTIDTIDVHYTNYSNAEDFEKKHSMAKLLKLIDGKPITMLPKIDNRYKGTPDYLIGNDVVADYKQLGSNDIDTIEKVVRKKGAVIDSLLTSRHQDKAKVIILHITNDTDAARLLSKLFASDRLRKFKIDIWLYQNDVLTKHKAK
jgi:SPP1 gp7 family putative phage head morphogenesis protein